MRILMGAQSCGFGPVAKLAAISRLIPQHERVFCGDTVAVVYARRNAAMFDRLHDTGAERAGLLDELIEQSDCVVSVMDAELVCRAYAAGRPVVMVDSLFSFWQHEVELDRLAELCRDMPRGRAEAVLERLAPLRPHEQILAAHLLCDHSIVQNLRGVPERMARFRELGAGPMHLTGSIIDTQVLDGISPQAEADCDLLINIGGFKNFLLDYDVNNAYLKLFDRWIPDLLKDWERFDRLTVCGGAFSEGREHQVEVRGRHASFRMLPHNELLQQVGTVPHYMLTPGLTSIHEAISIGRLPMALPEQHYGHVFNLRSLDGTLFHSCGVRLTDVAPEHPVPQDDFTGTAAIVALAERILEEEELYKRFRHMLNSRIEQLVGFDERQRADGVAELRARLAANPISQITESLFGTPAGAQGAIATGGRR
ncbi:hypothetical protein POF50_028980 [Streptomyces sp. SL13]|jgi:hypothetical protein|uniref:Uncharacterized protein n=1 Tax=Streptantibioticus silvisoli TaxID=2705255 RepID=A0AA90KBH5_9ACTN|nr:hypothetical protein [Streptantibioticus silvisoli]MDI5961386.1 hypothetical protein [Streptantibioticus silvisoli]MDI5973332.1 hypothetical protein [Streptantibioticus silvisoli]